MIGILVSRNIGVPTCWLSRGTEKHHVGTQGLSRDTENRSCRSCGDRGTLQGHQEQVTWGHSEKAAI